MKEKINIASKVLYEGFFNSYSQIFFSNRKVLAFIILFVTFFDQNAGICGIIGVLTANGIAYLMGFNRMNISLGFYGFNALLVSLGLGVYFNLNLELFVILFFGAFLTLMLSLLFEGVIGKYRVPFLSIPFLIALWLITLATRNFTALTLSHSDVYALNEMYSWGGIGMLKIYSWFNDLNLNEAILVYFKSLGAIFFQYNVIAGFLLSIGLLIYSRQAFILSILGYTAAYLFYIFIGANINELNYTYIGFNFILTAIAIGGYFIIPSFYSYLFVLLLTPIISILLASTASIFSIYQLPVYSLPFNIIVIVFLYILKFREYRLQIPEVVFAPKGSPEENLYQQKNAKERFSNFYYIPIELPVRGEWHVSQAHDGEITHKDKWKHAWDFDIIDEAGKTYNGDGLLLDDYYCYNKPVIAPADGIIESIVYDVGDNEIGDVNLENNWGNTIIIKHTPYLYSKISHLKAGSFKVSAGEFVKKGTILAHSGNSGRSPEPHVHFQLQSTPHIGSDTLDYPISHYIIRKNNGKIDVKSFCKPLKDEIISNLQKESLIYDAFHFIPGQSIKFSVENDAGKSYSIEWDVVTDIYNHTYIYCKKSKSKAFIYNDGKTHYFTDFYGNKSSLLYYFYLASYKIVMSYYKDIEITDMYPLNKLTRNNLFLWLQDIIAPFYMFIRCRFKCLHYKSETSIDLEGVTYKTKSEIYVFGKRIRTIDFDIEIKENRINTFIIYEKNRKIKAVWED